MHHILFASISFFYMLYSQVRMHCTQLAVRSFVRGRKENRPSRRRPRTRPPPAPDAAVDFTHELQTADYAGDRGRFLLQALQRAITLLLLTKGRSLGNIYRARARRKGNEIVRFFSLFLLLSAFSRQKLIVKKSLPTFSWRSSCRRRRRHCVLVSQQLGTGRSNERTNETWRIRAKEENRRHIYCS